MGLQQQPSFPLTQAYVPTGASHELEWGDLGRYKWTKVDINASLKGEMQRGNDAQALGEAPGFGDVSLKVEMPQLEAERLLNNLGALPLTKRSTVQFTGREAGTTLDVKYTLEGVRLQTLPVSVEGGKASNYALDCTVVGILRNGQKLW